MDQGFTENESSKAIAKFLDLFGGAIVIGTISAAIFLYLQNGTLPFRALVVSGILLVSGTFILFCGLFWERIAPRIGVTFTAKLARAASSPVSYVLVILALWGYLAIISVIAGVQRNNEIVALRNDQQSITQALDRFVLPRQLSERQMDSIGGYLKQFPSVVFSFDIAKGDEEAGQYAADLRRALEKGGWHLSAKDPYTYVEETPYVGLNIGFRQTPGHAQAPTDYRNPTANMVLLEAFGLAGVRVDGSGTGTDSTTTEDEIKITVGHRRRDSYALPCEPKQELSTAANVQR
jgi:hypothetical protein